MCVKIKKNYYRIELNQCQLEKLKEMTCDLNIKNAFTTSIPYIYYT